MVPGAIAERLRRQFPRYEVLPGASLASLPEEVPTPPVPHHRFRSDDPNALIQTGPRLLTVNMLPTYQGFEVFRELILTVLEHYCSVANPGNPMRVGLRYINLIRLVEGQGSLNDYLKCTFSYPEELPRPPRELAARLLFDYAEKGTLGLSIAFPSRIGDGAKGTLLDLDFFWSGPPEFPLEQFSSWLDEAHGIIYTAFLSTLHRSVVERLRGDNQ